MYKISKLYLLPILILLLTTLMACSSDSVTNSGPENEGITTTEELKQGVYDLFALSEEFVQNKDVDGMVNRFTENGSLKLPGAPLLTGHPDLRGNYAGTFELENFQVTQKIISISISNAEDFAYVLSTFEVSFNTPGGPIADQGISLMVLKRVNYKSLKREVNNESNDWKIAAEILSPGPKAQAD